MSSSFNCVETIACLLRLNQYLAADKVPCSRIEHSDSTCGEAQTSTEPFDFQSNALPNEPQFFTKNHIKRQLESMT